MALRNYTNISKEGQLQTAIGTGDTTLVLSGSGLVNIPATPFYVRIDPDTASEEIILVGSGSSATTLLNCTRGYDGTSAFSHGSGAKIRHCVAAEFYNKADAHVEASTNVHGLSGGSAVAGTTQTQTLTNKTINSSVIDVAHSTSPAASQAIKVSANAATGRDGFVWDNTGGSTGRSVVVRSGGVDRFVLSSAGLATSNSATGTDKALSVQQSATERFFLQNDGHADFGLQAGGATTDRVRIRTQSTQNALAIKDSGGFNIFTIGGSGNVDASGYIATATNLSATGSLTVGTTASVTGASTLTGDVTLPLPASGTTPRLNIRGRTSGFLIEGKDQAGTVTYSLGVDGGYVANGKAFIHDKNSPTIAKVTSNAVVPSPVTDMVVYSVATGKFERYNGSGWVPLNPSFFGYQVSGSPQTITASTPVALTMTGEHFDDINGHSTSTNTSRYTPTVPGRYKLFGMLSVDNTLATGSVFTCQFRKNGAVQLSCPYGQGVAQNQAFAANNVFCYGEVVCNGTTDYIEMWINSNVTVGTFANATDQMSWWTAEWVGLA